MFTEEEEEILKLLVVEMKAKIELNNVNQTMGDAIRAEFSIIDQKIRNETKSIYEPLQVKVEDAKNNLKTRLAQKCTEEELVKETSEEEGIN